MIFYLIFFIIILIPLLCITLRGKDAFPFSHYPMFSNLSSPNQVEVFRIALETTDGKSVWWKSEFYRYPEFVGRRLKELEQTESDGLKAFTSLDRQRYLIEVLRLIEAEEKSLDQYRAFLIVRRTVDNDVEIKDDVIERIPLEGMKKIKRDN